MFKQRMFFMGVQAVSKADMREIKFRAWDKEQKHKGMVNFELEGADYYGLHFHECDGEGHYSISFDNSEDDTQYFEQTRFVLMQYTGLKDKNGKEIYEGDIVELIPILNGVEGSKRRGTITYENQICGFMVGKGFFMNEIDKIEVIGNIYENKEQLVRQ